MSLSFARSRASLWKIWKCVVMKWREKLPCRLEMFPIRLKCVVEYVGNILFCFVDNERKKKKKTCKRKEKKKNLFKNLGTNYKGWQRQTLRSREAQSIKAPKRTVQETIEVKTEDDRPISTFFFFFLLDFMGLNCLFVILLECIEFICTTLCSSFDCWSIENRCWSSCTWSNISCWFVDESARDDFKRCWSTKQIVDDGNG